jgi:energy-coupling factor transport system substrate-specific component
MFAGRLGAAAAWTRAEIAMIQRILSGAIYALSTAIGVAAFLAPFFAPIVQQSAQPQAGAATAPLLLTALVGLCFLALLFEVQGSELSAKSVALLGILVAINSVLRFAEVAVPGPGGFSPIFMLIILTGYVFGGQFGFLMGTMTLLVSGLITGGVGPWLPYQMFAAGWVGLSAALLRPLIQRLGGEGRRGELIVLALFGALWGFAYGAIMNLWFWPYAAGPAQQYWVPGTGLVETLRRYLAFYVLTSLAWDALGAVGNVLLLLAFGAPIMRALRRFRDRLGFVYQPEWSEQ